MRVSKNFLIFLVASIIFNFQYVSQYYIFHIECIKINYSRVLVNEVTWDFNWNGLKVKIDIGNTLMAKAAIDEFALPSILHLLFLNNHMLNLLNFLSNCTKVQIKII